MLRSVLERIARPSVSDVLREDALVHGRSIGPLGVVGSLGLDNRAGRASPGRSGTAFARLACPDVAIGARTTAIPRATASQAGRVNLRDLPRLSTLAAEIDYGALQTKLAASSMLPVPEYRATCG
jgi:hypothetical protein